MADRSWNAVDARILDEDWSRVAILVMEQIIIKCPDAYGVYKLPRGCLRRFFDGILAEGQPTVDKAIEELEKDGVIKLYGDTVWIVKKWGRSKFTKSENNLKGAIKHLVEHFPEVASDFQAKYPSSTPLVPPKSAEVPPKSSKGRTTDSESDSEPEELKDKTDNPELVGFVLELLPDREFSPTQMKQQSQALERLMTIDRKKIDSSYPEADWSEHVLSVLRWMRSDTEERGNWKGWATVFNSIPRLRQNGCQKFINARNQYHSHRSKADATWDAETAHWFEDPPLPPGADP